MEQRSCQHCGGRIVRADANAGAPLREFSRRLAANVHARLVCARNLAWHGWAERSFDGVLDNQEWMKATIGRTVARISARLPRR